MTEKADIVERLYAGEGDYSGSEAADEIMRLLRIIEKLVVENAKLRGEG